MYTSKTNYRVSPRTIGGLIEDVFQNGFHNFFTEDGWNEKGSAPANIFETDTEYQMQIIAPGLKKDDFKINVDRNVLHISYDHTADETETAGKWLRKEYKLQTFRRSFTLNDKINVSGISAKYNEGILTVHLPKKEAQEPTTQEIKVG